MFHLYAANSAGQASNKFYPQKHEIQTTDDLKRCVSYDHVAACFAQDERSNQNFLYSDCLVMDIDNDHSEDNWITPNSLSEYFPNVLYFCATSRNHLKTKGNLSARPRFHVYFPIPITQDAKAYADLKKMLSVRYPFFDRNATDAARFIFGNASAEVSLHEGEQFIDQFMDEQLSEELFFALPFAKDTPIGEGNRNNTLSRFAGRVLIRYGDSPEAKELFDNKAACCKPPLSQTELELIWKSAKSFAAKIAEDPSYISPEAYEQLLSLKPDDLTDVGQASVMATEYANKARYSPSTKWLVYQDGTWLESEPKARIVAQDLTSRQLEEARSKLTKANTAFESSGAKDLFDQSSKKKAMEQASEDQFKAYQDYQEALSYHAYVMKRRDSKKISACLTEAAPLLEINPEVLDADPYLLNTPKGTYDLRTGLQKPHDPMDFITKQTSVEPSNKGMPKWLETLDLIFQSDAELINYVQRICGLAAIGKVLVESLIIAYGDGANGKSTFWNTVSRVLGSYASSISADVLIAGRKNNAKNDMAETRGRRLLIASETEEGRRLSTSSAKQLASTDKISAEKKYKDPFSFTPSHTLVLYTNHLPKVGATDNGIWRRLVVIPFEAKIARNADIKNYADILYGEAGEAILAWIIEGARLIHKEGYKLDIPAKVLEATQAYRESNDWFSHFLEDCCRQGKDLIAPSGKLYQTYRSWAISQGEYIRSTSDFYAAIDKLGFRRMRTRTGRFVTGLEILSEFI